MVNWFKILVWGFTVMVVCLGCERPAEELVLATVNGESLTREEVRTAVEIQAKIMELSGSPIPKDRYIEWANDNGLGMFWPLIHTKLILQEIAREGLAVTTSDVAIVLATYNRQARQNDGSLQDLSARFGSLAAAFRHQAEQSAKISAYQRTHWCVDVTEAKIDAFYQSKTNDLLKAKQIDQQAKEKADRAYQRLQKGEDWMAVARLLSEDRLVGKAQERYAASWLHVRADAMGMENLAERLPTMKVGDFTPPIETRWGLLIVRLVEKKKGVYRIARMLFRLARPVEIPTTREKAKAELTESLKQTIRAECLKQLREKATLTFPLGTNFTFEVYETIQDKKTQEKGK